MTINEETAQLLQRVAAVFRIKEGDTFRYKAYINASIAIENLSEPITDIWRRGELNSIPGLGESLTSYLDEYFKTGKVRHFDSIAKKVPAGMFPLMDIRGIGPVTAYKIAKKFHLNDQDSALADLKEILLSGKLTTIEGFKEKTIAKIQKALSIKSFGKGRMPLYQALPIADDFVRFLRLSPAILEAEPLGSLRRKVPTIGDIDVAICSDSPKRAMDYALSYPQIKTVVNRGDKLSHVKLKNGLEMDIKLSQSEAWGSLLQHYTGSKLHNIHLRSLAKEKGLSLSEYGITQKGKQYKFTTETAFYHFLGLDYIPPEMRENTGEIELAQNHQLPQTITLEDIKGDLHIHSDFSYPSSHDHGSSSLAEILEYGETHHYEYIGISDHNPKFSDLSESQKEKIIADRTSFLLAEKQKYEKSVKHRTLNLLIGLEVDIRADGELAVSENILEKLDYVIVSIHSSFEADSDTNTKRIFKALAHPKVKILGHPTGRMINGREAIAADWPKIFSFCRDSRKMIEINAYPSRLDLPEDLIKLAVSLGVKLIINTDSHDVSQMNNMCYGVWQAARGFAGKSAIANTLSYKDLRSMLELSS